MKTPLALFSVITVLSIPSFPQSKAADAAFSNDGSRVFLLRHSDKLVVADLYAGRGVPVSLNLEGQMQGLSNSPNGLLVATDKMLYRVNPHTYASAKLCAAAEGEIFVDVAYDPVGKGILVCCSTTNYEPAGTFYLKPGASTPTGIYIRRVDYLRAPVFDKTGELFFATEGDIWKGQLAFEEERISLTAIRYAPVATRETQNSTPGQMGAQELAPAGDRLYACVRRMGGSGWGNVVSLNKPIVPSPRDEEGPAEQPQTDLLQDHLNIYMAALSSVRIYGENGTSSWLCATPDESRVFFVTYDEGGPQNQHGGPLPTCWLAENDGEPKPITLELPNDR